MSPENRSPKSEFHHFEVSDKLSAERARRQLRQFAMHYRRYFLGDALSLIAPESAEASPETLGARKDLHGFLAEVSFFEKVDALPFAELALLRDQLSLRACAARLQFLLDQSGLVSPVYHHLATFEENDTAPWDSLPETPIAATPIAWSLLGRPVRYPFGVPASPLTSSSAWIAFFARRGFNVLTFKTVGTAERLAHPFPNWVFLEEVEAWEPGGPITSVKGGLNIWPGNLRSFSTANSFGVPSPEPDVWKLEVKESLNTLAPGQMLIVSVVGDSDRFEGEDLADDFVTAAAHAVDAGATEIELNLSCPNTLGQPPSGAMAPPICVTDPALTGHIVEKVKQKLDGDVRIIAKLSYMTEDQLRSLMVGERLGERIDGVSGINTVQTRAVDSDGRSLFRGTAQDKAIDRVEAGVSGAAIKQLGLGFCRSLARIRHELKFRYDIIGMGGVQSAEDVPLYFQAGANAVQSATGSLMHPGLPAEIQARRIEAEAEQTRQGGWQAVRDSLASGRWPARRVRRGSAHH